MPARSWSTHGWELLDATELHTALAAEWLALYQLIADRDALWVELRGGGQQLDTAKEIGRRGEDARRMTMRSVTEAAMRSQLSSLGVDTKPLHLAAMKLLRSRPGGKDQDVHFDTGVLQNALKRWSLVLYCTNTMSTAVPKPTAQEMAPAFIQTEFASADQQLVCDQLCDKKNFISMPVQPGNLLAFNTSVAHYGVANRATVDRVVVYALFSPDDTPYQDDEQRFPLGAPDDSELAPEPASPPTKKPRNEN